MGNKSLKKIRAEMNLTQTQLGLLMGMDQRNYTKIENGLHGQKPTKQQIMHLKVLEFVYKNGLLDELTKYIKSKRKDDT